MNKTKLLNWKVLYVLSWILVAPFLNLPPGMSLSFDEAWNGFWGSPGRLIETLQGQPQAQAPLPVPRNELPPVGNNASIAPCAPPPPTVAQNDSHRQVAIADSPPPSTKPRVPPSTAAVLENIRPGQTMQGLLDAVRDADDTETALDGQHDWFFYWNESQGRYRVGVKNWKVVSVRVSQQ